jgi:DNA/RNA-binding domain of Phe-tRNA-synthetase-like protein
MLKITPAWRDAYPGAAVGVLAMEGVSNPACHPELDALKMALERDLRARYGEMDRVALRALPVYAAYAGYYKRFKKSYHVQLQVESIAWKGRSIPSVAALVEAMFMAELRNGLLTAGHDLAVVEPPVRIDVALGGEVYRRLDGVEQGLQVGDMYIADARGVLSSILYGPDERTRIQSHTQRALFTVYAPAGIGPDVVYKHLEDLRDDVCIVQSEARVIEMEVYRARCT